MDVFTPDTPSKLKKYLTNFRIMSKRSICTLAVILLIVLCLQNCMGTPTASQSKIGFAENPIGLRNLHDESKEEKWVEQKDGISKKITLGNIKKKDEPKEEEEHHMFTSSDLHGHFDTQYEDEEDENTVPEPVEEEPIKADSHKVDFDEVPEVHTSTDSHQVTFSEEEEPVTPEPQEVISAPEDSEIEALEPLTSKEVKFNHTVQIHEVEVPQITPHVETEEHTAEIKIPQPVKSPESQETADKDVLEAAKEFEDFGEEQEQLHTKEIKFPHKAEVKEEQIENPIKKHYPSYTGSKNQNTTEGSEGKGKSGQTVKTRGSETLKEYGNSTKSDEATDKITLDPVFIENPDEPEEETDLLETLRPYWPQIALVAFIALALLLTAFICMKMYKWCFGSESYARFENEEVNPYYPNKERNQLNHGSFKTRDDQNIVNFRSNELNGELDPKIFYKNEYSQENTQDHRNIKLDLESQPEDRASDMRMERERQKEIQRLNLDLDVSSRYSQSGEKPDIEVSYT